ncbi:aldo/keto reductase [Promicromonospora sukumoe]|uniref:Diketogulonate reductase-like aldo/keto reductase n=1 Tax=Promicromonospora sukumoe TaxID=88382 RepID=A0A7W3PDH6_9MICO|nr:aldo/keto reductase [Promicromonospora sukumoe]MBA8807793.1 diketogulonate reductase-like aldo/keto reductase [Promicromonospora sukumoe]
MSESFGRTVTLRDGVAVPQVGLGVFQVPADEAQAVVEQALEGGYRHIDTAAAYVNERGVGAAVRASGLPRDELFVTSKLRNGDQGYDRTLRAYDDSCERLGLDALDLYLIHWPNPSAGLWQDSWRALQRLRAEGRVSAVGVSNFLVEHLDELARFADEMPAINQIELHPTFQQADVAAACRAHGIAVEAYSPLGQGADLGHPSVTAIADELGVTPAQVILRWHVDRGRVVIPKSVSPVRMRANASLEGVALTADHLAAIDALDSAERIGGDPRTFSISQIR